MPHDDFADRTIAEIGQGAYRDSPGPEVPLPMTSAELGLLTSDALGRLVAFLRDLIARPPMAGPAWVAHRQVLATFVDELDQARTLRYYDELHEAAR